MKAKRGIASLNFTDIARDFSPFYVDALDATAAPLISWGIETAPRKKGLDFFGRARFYAT